MRGALVPVGTRYFATRMESAAGAQRLRASWPHHEVAPLSSGTAALAVALRACRRLRPVAAPRVIVPGYGCPSLIAACVAAGCEPVLVDLQPGRWGYSNELQAALTGEVVAVLAVDLLGVGDGAAELGALCNPRGIPIVQDSAQSIPPDPRRDWSADLVVLSFGRGKPLNLLGGGALLYRAAVADAVRTEFASLPVAADAGLPQRLKGVAYNLLTARTPYALVRKLPGLGLGDTRYEALTAPRRLDPRTCGAIATALDAYEAQPDPAQQWLQESLPQLEAAGYRALAGSRWPSHPARLLRFPLLAPDPATARRADDALSRAGLGSSRMYERELPRIDGLPANVSRQGPLPNAAALAARLLTLPLHHRVRRDDAGSIVAILLSCVER